MPMMRKNITQTTIQAGKRHLMLWAVWFLILPIHVCAQQATGYSWEQFVDEYLQYAAEQSDADNDVERYDWLEELEEVHRHPIDINRAEPGDLQMLHFLSDEQVDSLLAKRDRLRDGFRSLGELMTVRQLSYRDRAWLSQLLMFRPLPTSADSATLERYIADRRREASDTTNRWYGGVYEALATLDKPLYRRAGFYRYDSDDYLTKMFTGYNFAHSLRLRYSWHQRVMYGATVQQDVGERFGAYGSKPWDYESAYFYYRSDPERVGRTTFSRYTIAVGDYKMSVAQGLLMGSKSWSPRSQIYTGLRAESFRLRPNTGTDESNFQRGFAAAASFGDKGQWSVLAFGSVRRLDGTLKQVVAEDDANGDDTTESGKEYGGDNEDYPPETEDHTHVGEDQAPADTPDVITAWKTDGMHRTFQEIAKRGVATQWLGGTRVGYRCANLNIGLNAVGIHYDKAYQPAPRAYNVHYLHGQNAAGLSADYAVQGKRWSLQGELAFDDSLHYASSLMLRLQPMRSLLVQLQERSLDHRFVSPHGFTLQSNSQVQNEHGVLLSVRYTGLRRFAFYGYADFAYHPFPVYLADKASHRFEACAEADYQRNSHWGHRLIYKCKGREQNVSGYGQIEGLGDGVLLSWRLTQHLRYQSTWTDGIRTIAFGADGAAYYSQGSSYEKKKDRIVGHGTTWGAMLYGRASTTFLKRLKASCMLAVFATEDYYTRCYAYLPQLQGSVIMPTFYGKGFSAVVMGECPIWRGLSAALRLSLVHYFDREKIGSGVNCIDGRNKSDLGLQMRYRF